MHTRLISYIRAIHGLDSAVRIATQRSTTDAWVDQGFEVRKEETQFLFANGVRIVRVIEQDQFPSEQACAECWISYEVATGPAGPVTPARMCFNSRCREAFWIKYHSD